MNVLAHFILCGNCAQLLLAFGRMRALLTDSLRHVSRLVGLPACVCKFLYPFPTVLCVCVFVDVAAPPAVALHVSSGTQYVSNYRIECAQEVAAVACAVAMDRISLGLGPASAVVDEYVNGVLCRSTSSSQRHECTHSGKICFRIGGRSACGKSCTRLRQCTHAVAGSHDVFMRLCAC